MPRPFKTYAEAFDDFWAFQLSRCPAEDLPHYTETKMLEVKAVFLAGARTGHAFENDLAGKYSKNDEYFAARNVLLNELQTTMLAMAERQNQLAHTHNVALDASLLSPEDRETIRAALEDARLSPEEIEAISNDPAPEAPSKPRSRKR